MQIYDMRQDEKQEASKNKNPNRLGFALCNTSSEEGRRKWVRLPHLYLIFHSSKNNSGSSYDIAPRYVNSGFDFILCYVSKLQFIRLRFVLDKK